MYIRLFAAALLGVVFCFVSNANGQDVPLVDVPPIVVPVPEAAPTQSVIADQAVQAPVQTDAVQATGQPTYYAPEPVAAPAAQAQCQACQPVRTCKCNGKCGCTKEKKEAATAKMKSAYKGVFYANDFSYLNDPCYDD